MLTPQKLFGVALAFFIAGCGSGTGATGVDDVQGDSGDAQIAPLDAQDATAGTDAVSDVADVPPPQDVWVDKDLTPVDVPPTDIAPIDVAPADAADVQPDVALDTGDAFVAANCSGFGGGGMCDPGMECWSFPCPKCGAMPQGFCLPTLQAGTCYDYTDCNGGECHGANPMAGVAGWCLSALEKPGTCWPEVSALVPDCYPGATCDGAFICPPMGACPKADSPGTCNASPEQKGKVYLWERNGGVVTPGENVRVTWVNYTGASIFLAGCATYSIESSSDNQTWKDLGPGVMCAWEGIAVEVPAGGYFDTLGWQGPQNGPVLNYRFHGGYSVGCTPGKALSQANCTGSAEVYSDAFFVGLVP